MANDVVVATALVDVCRSRVPDLPADGPLVDQFVEAVRLHRIAPLAHVLLRDDRPEIAERLRPDRDVAMAIHLRSSVVLAQLGQALGDIPWAAFKGPVLSEFAHPVAGLRTYGDIDVLVGPRDLREVSDRLVAIDWQVGDHVDHHHNPDTPGEMHWRTPSGLLVDMHWSMINMAPTRRRFTIATPDLLARGRRVQLGLAQAPVLEEVDAFVHVCLHAGLTGAHRMLWLLDVDQLARQVTDWDAVVDRACTWRAEAQVAVVLRRARAVLDTPYPDGLCARLGVSRSTRRIMDLADRRSPVPSLAREESVAKAVSRAVRPSGLETVGVLANKAFAGTWNRRPGAPSARVPIEDWVEADADAQAAYLAAVEAEAATGSAS